MFRMIRLTIVCAVSVWIGWSLRGQLAVHDCADAGGTWDASRLVCLGLRGAGG